MRTISDYLELFETSFTLPSDVSCLSVYSWLVTFCYRLNCVLPTPPVLIEVPTPGTSECDFIWR